MRRFGSRKLKFSVARSDCSRLSFVQGPASIYDPVFTDADKEFIQGLGMKCLPDTASQLSCAAMPNEALISFLLFQDAKHPVERPTILYMPHCDLELYENIIGANWSEENLRRIIFIANCFSDYTDKYGFPSV